MSSIEQQIHEALLQSDAYRASPEVRKEVDAVFPHLVKLGEGGRNQELMEAFHALEERLKQFYKPRTGEYGEGSALEAHQVEWVRQGIEAGFDRSRRVNAPLFKLDASKGVPAFPSKEATLRSALRQLTPELVAYMMEEGYSFQMILETPSDRLDLQETLINGQPHHMDTPDQAQQDVGIPGSAKTHLLSCPSFQKIQWKWNFVQGSRLVGAQKGEDLTLKLEDRLKQVRRNRPKGVHGMRRFEWAALEANGLNQGKPLDIHFKDDAKNTPDYEEWNVTLLDGEGEFTEGQYRCLVGGRFSPYSRSAYLYGCDVGIQDDLARFRGSVDGVIETKSRIESDPRLASLVAIIDALPEAKRTVRGKVRTGSDIARAIPDKEAFLAEVALMQERTFFELNERGQLVMKDGCAEAYGLRDDFPAAQTRQKRLVYRDGTGKIQVLANVNFTVDKDTGDRVLPNNGERIAARSILMERGLPTLTLDGGEYARMNDKGQFERKTIAWVEDDTITNSSLARSADWSAGGGCVISFVYNSSNQFAFLGSRGVLRVNLNFES